MFPHRGREYVGVKENTMKTTFALFTLLVSTAAFAQLEYAPTTHVFAPSGFDDNDATELVVTGYLRNPCYTRPMVKSRVKSGNIEVQVLTQKVSGSPDGKLCADVVVPYSESVQVGQVGAGNYQIAVNQKSLTRQTGQIHIETATMSAVDEHPYALVQYVEQNPSNMKFYLNGQIYSNCFVLSDVKYLSNNKDAISILPILKQVSNHCAQVVTPFRVEIKPPLTTLTNPHFLLHVRSADGKSVNFIGYKK